MAGLTAVLVMQTAVVATVAVIALTLEAGQQQSKGRICRDAMFRIGELVVVPAANAAALFFAGGGRPVPTAAKPFITPFAVRSSREALCCSLWNCRTNTTITCQRTGEHKDNEPLPFLLSF